MVAAPVVLVLVAGDAIVKRDLARQATLGEKLEGAIDGGVADLGVFLLDQTVQFVGGEVFTGFEKRAENRVALGGLLQAHAFEVLVENALRFAHHFARDRGLVIDAFLEHAGAARGRSQNITSILKMKFKFDKGGCQRPRIDGRCATKRLALFLEQTRQTN